MLLCAHQLVATAGDSAGLDGPSGPGCLFFSSELNTERNTEPPNSEELALITSFTLAFTCASSFWQVVETLCSC